SYSRAYQAETILLDKSDLDSTDVENLYHPNLILNKKRQRRPFVIPLLFMIPLGQNQKPMRAVMMGAPPPAIKKIHEEVMRQTEAEAIDEYMYHMQHVWVFSKLIQIKLLIMISDDEDIFEDDLDILDILDHGFPRRIYERLTKETVLELLELIEGDLEYEDDVYQDKDPLLRHFQRPCNHSESRSPPQKKRSNKKNGSNSCAIASSEEIKKAVSLLNQPVDDEQIYGYYVASEMREIKKPKNKRKLRRLINEAIKQISDIDAAELESSNISNMSTPSNTPSSLTSMLSPFNYSNDTNYIESYSPSDCFIEASDFRLQML
ncbi:hypothetical protein NQ314_008066, partial [Rhamnusium bicolor]